MKPANIFLNSTGQVKILDFGLAKLVDAAKDWDTDGPQPSAKDDGSKVTSAPLPDSDADITKLGSALGAAGYMSPTSSKPDSTHSEELTAELHYEDRKSPS